MPPLQISGRHEIYFLKNILYRVGSSVYILYRVVASAPPSRAANAEDLEASMASPSKDSTPAAASLYPRVSPHGWETAHRSDPSLHTAGIVRIGAGAVMVCAAYSRTCARCDAILFC